MIRRFSIPLVTILVALGLAAPAFGDGGPGGGSGGTVVYVPAADLSVTVVAFGSGTLQCGGSEVRVGNDHTAVSAGNTSC